MIKEAADRRWKWLVIGFICIGDIGSIHPCFKLMVGVSSGKSKSVQSLRPIKSCFYRNLNPKSSYCFKPVAVMWLIHLKDKRLQCNNLKWASVFYVEEEGSKNLEWQCFKNRGTKYILPYFGYRHNVAELIRELKFEKSIDFSSLVFLFTASTISFLPARVPVTFPRLMLDNIKSSVRFLPNHNLTFRLIHAQRCVVSVLCKKWFVFSKFAA